MTNQYYNAAPDAVAGTTVRSAQFNDNNDSLEQGFDILPDPINLYVATQNFTDATVDVLNPNLYLATVNATVVSSLVDGAFVALRMPSANTGPSQLNLNNLGAKQIRTPFGQPIVAGDIPEGAVVGLRYTLQDDYWQLESALTAVVRAEAAAQTAEAAAQSIAELEPVIRQNEAEIESLNARVGQTSIRVAQLLAPISWLFQKNQLIDTMTGRMRVDRLSRATTLDRYGNLEFFASDFPREDFQGWLFEGSRINYLTTPETPATQNVTIPAGTYYLTVVGTGRAETTYGNATQAEPLTFTSTGETLTVTLFGSLDRWQLENGAFATSFIPNNVGTRQADNLRIDVRNNVPRLTTPWTVSFIVDNLVNDFAIFEATGFLLQVNASGDLLLNNTSLATGIDFTSEKVVTLTYNGTAVTPYIDATAQTAVNMSFTDVTSGEMRFGARTDGSLPMFGHIKNYRAHDFEATVQEVGYLYIQRA